MHWKHKNLLILSLSVVFAVMLSRFQPFHEFLTHLGGFEYLGAFIAGVLFTSVFTTTISIVMIAALSETMHPGALGLIAGAGAVFGDFLIFKFVRDDLIEELEPIYEELGGKHITKLFNTKYFGWTLPVIGALIIASPFPDELGISIMGLARLKTYEFLPISFFSNTSGILLIAIASSFLQ